METFRSIIVQKGACGDKSEIMRLSCENVWFRIYNVLVALILSCAGVIVAVFLFNILLTSLEGFPKGEAARGLNDRPIIGILAQEFHPSKVIGTPNDGSYIAASYVKMVESSAARVVPIMIGQDRQYYENLVNWLNGIVFPGGGVDMWAKGGYGEASKIIYDLVLEKNKQGTSYPLLGVCLGFEMLAVASADMGKNVLETLDKSSENPLPLQFVPNIKESSLYRETPDKILHLLSTRNITANHHKSCVTEDSLRSNNLTSVWKVLSTSSVPGKTFISSMEHVEFPQIFGVQFHPEKMAFEWQQTSDPHTLEAAIVNRWFYDYFVEQARKNDNLFPDKKEEKSNLIYNYVPKFLDTYFVQIYKFQEGTQMSEYSVNSVIAVNQ